MANKRWGTNDYTEATSVGSTDQCGIVQAGVLKYFKLSTLRAWILPPIVFQLAASDETTAITTGTSKLTFRAPYAFTLTGVRASLTTASSSGTPTFDINMNGATILSTKLTIDASEKTSVTAATPPVISTSAITDDAELTIDFDVAGTGAAGVKITLIGTYP